MRRLGTTVKNTIESFQRHECSLLAAALAYYGLFSLFPLLLLLIVFATYFFPAQDMQAQIANLTAYYFPGSADFVERNFYHLFTTKEQVGILAALILLWASSGVFSALARSLNRIWRVENSRSFLHQKLISLATAGTLGVAFLILVLASMALQVLESLSESWGLLLINQLKSGLSYKLLTILIPLIITVLLFYVVMRVVPNVETKPRDVWPGASLAALFFEVAKRLFTWYLQNLSKYALVFGSLGTGIVLLLWIYISAAIFLFGAEFAATLSEMRQTR